MPVRTPLPTRPSAALLEESGMSSFGVRSSPTIRKKNIFRTRRPSTAAPAEGRPSRPQFNTGRSRGGSATGQCPQRACAQISVTYVAAARRAIRVHHEWLTIDDRPGLAVPKSYGRHPSGALRSHGSPRCRAPPRSGLRGEACPATRPELGSVVSGPIRCERAWGFSKRRLVTRHAAALCELHVLVLGRCGGHTATTSPG